MRQVCDRQMCVCTSGALSLSGGESYEVGALALDPGDEVAVLRPAWPRCQAWRLGVVALRVVLIWTHTYTGHTRIHRTHAYTGHTHTQDTRIHRTQTYTVERLILYM